jgi:hypothetical protein
MIASSVLEVMMHRREGAMQGGNLGLSQTTAKNLP